MFVKKTMKHENKKSLKKKMELIKNEHNIISNGYRFLKYAHKIVFLYSNSYISEVLLCFQLSYACDINFKWLGTCNAFTKANIY